MEQFSESDICALTEDLWLSMLNLPTTPDVDGQLPESKGHTIIGIVNVSGTGAAPSCCTCRTRWPPASPPTC